MKMSEWAKREVEIACKKENPNWDGKSFDYGIACYQSALKAFKSLCEDEHSGMSIAFTQGILNRLIDVKCLTPIEDTEDIWNEIHDYEDGTKEYRCRRMSSLFKKLLPDGTVKYSDVERIIKVDQNGIPWHSGDVSRLIEKMFPIEMPYYPATEKYKVYSEDFLVNPENGDYDTWAYLYVEKPDGEKVDLNLFYTEKEGQTVQISKEEYEELKEKAFKQ